jgi:sulfite exporter TauE/SafE
MILWASAHLAAYMGVRLPRLPGSGAVTWIRGEFGELLLALRDQPAVVRSGAMGLLTTLLPCGWLYTFVVTAGGTGNAISGAAVMAVFWAGTVPMLFAVGVGARQLGRPLARHLPVASAALVLLLGVLSLAGKLQQIPTIGAGAGAQHSHAGHVGR